MHHDRIQSVPSRPPPLPLRGHLALAVLAGILLGAVAAVGAGEPATAWLAAACWGLTGALLAPLQWAAVRGLGAVAPVRAAAAALRGRLATLRGYGPPRAPGLAAVAGLLVAAALVVGLALFGRAVHERLETVTEAGVAGAILAAALVGALLAAVVAAGPLAALLAAALRAVDRRLRLPLPAHPAPWAALLFAVPLVVGALLVLSRVRPHVGALAAGLDAAVWAGVEIALVPLAAWLARRLAKLALRGALVAAVLLATAGVLAAPADDARALVGAEHPGAGAAIALRVLSDVDRDGSAALLGGGDCAPFDAAVHPGAPDAASDGIDSDCDGIDPAPQPPGAVVSNALPPALVRDWDVVLIVVDALRADQVGAIAGAGEFTPFLDAFARESLVFTNASSTASGTRVAMPTLLTGTWPARTPWRPGTTDLADAAVTLPERLGAAGWQTIGVVNRWVAGQMKGLAQGFDEYGPNLTLDEQKAHQDRAAGLLTHRLIDRLVRRSGDAPLFLYVYYEDAHHPYTTRKSPERRFGAAAKERYDGDIAYADRQLGVLLEHLRWSGRWDRTVVIVVADHGEEFGEHGGQRHARTLFEEVLRVPIVVRVPGLEPRQVDAPVSLVDVVPTVLELTGQPLDAASVDGRSLFLPALAGVVDPDRPILSELRGQPRAHHLRAVRSGRWKLVQDLTASTVALYDLEADPGETADVAAAHPAVRDALLKTLAAASAAR
jgi:arylsulfatase A-like enzyme